MLYIGGRFSEASVEKLHNAHPNGALYAFEMDNIRPAMGQDTGSADEEMAHRPFHVLLVELLLLPPPEPTTTASILPGHVSQPTTKSSHRT